MKERISIALYPAAAFFEDDKHDPCNSTSEDVANRGVELGGSQVVEPSIIIIPLDLVH